MKKMFVLLFVIALAGMLHADSRHILHASFPDGTGLEILTQTTGATQIDPTGEMGIGPGAGSQDQVNRVVVDHAGNILFAYNLEASRGDSPNTVKIRIEPIGGKAEATILKDANRPGHHQYSGTHLPTVARVLEFASVATGQAVTLDILYNPSSGEKIYDVLRPIPGSVGVMSVTSVDLPEAASLNRISLNRIAMRVNGAAVPAPASSITGTAVRIDIPHEGTYVISSYDPHRTDPDHAFAQIAQADGKTLTWSMASAYVQITSASNVLTRAEKGTLWVFHDRHYQPDVVEIQSADTVDWLFPKK